MSSDDIKGKASSAAGIAKARTEQAADVTSQAASRAADRAEDAAGHAATASQGLASQAQDTAASLGSKVQDVASSAREMAGDVVGKAREQVQGLGESLPGSASDAYQAGQRAVSQGGDTLGRQVASRPLETLLLAGAIGYLVGWATSRS